MAIGTLIYKHRAKQLLLYDGMRYGSITPTDIDGLIDYHNRITVFFEVKTKGVPMPYGQRVALSRMLEDARKAGKHGIAIVAEHEVYDTNKDVLLKDCQVREVCTTEEPNWRPPKFPCSVKRMTDSYINFFTYCG